MLPPEEDQEIKGTVEGCLYRRIAREISTEQHGVITKRLGDLVLHHLNPDKGWKLHCKQEVQTEVDTSMKLMVNWLNQQAQQHDRKGGITSTALEKIERVVLSLPALTEDLLGKESVMLLSI